MSTGSSPSSQTETHSPANFGTHSASSASGPGTRRSARLEPVVHRRSHAKSRTGCKTCKKRRIKCDEHRPSCRNCDKHGVTCDFTSPDAPQLQPHGPSLSTHVPRDSGQINMMDLELMHNFTSFTCTTLTSDPAVRQMLRTTVVHMAVDCEYLMRVLLAVSGLHMARYRPEKRDNYISHAMQHHQSASSAAIDVMSNLSTENCEKLHLFSMLTVYYDIEKIHVQLGMDDADRVLFVAYTALGCPPNSVDLHPESPIVPHWLELLHGMEPIIHSLDPQNYRGVLTPLFDFGRSRLKYFLAATPPRNSKLLTDLEEFIHRTCRSPDLIEIYEGVIRHLRLMLILVLPRGTIIGQGYADMEGHYHKRHEAGVRSAIDINSPVPGSDDIQPPSSLEAWDILTWQWTVGRDFLPLLQGEHPKQEALVIFAHFLIPLKKLESQWWLEGWANHLMSKAWAALDDEHRHRVTWAIEEIGWIPPRK